jgi:demethoxyubiquinone hydroxylase (CLK1/Coq7/Cat5 family)
MTMIHLNTIYQSVAVYRSNFTLYLGVSQYELMDERSHYHQLIHILRNAYSGELAAAYAYRGHWKSVKNPQERERIQQIENEEWVHREKVGLMLKSFEADPFKLKEFKMFAIGKTVAFFCHIIGWFLPMYFAGKLESSNVEEYKSAAFFAKSMSFIL